MAFRLFENAQVKSSRISCIAHDNAETMRVQFRNGRVYDCTPVPREVYDLLVHASSVGHSYELLIARNLAIKCSVVNATLL